MSKFYGNIESFEILEYNRHVPCLLTNQKRVCTGWFQVRRALYFNDNLNRIKQSDYQEFDISLGTIQHVIVSSSLSAEPQ